MKCKRNGFTLVELLGVITLIAVIASIAAVSINMVVNRSNEKAWTATQKNLERAAETYALEFDIEFPYTDGNNRQYAEVSLKKLYDEGYIKGAISNPITEEKIEPNDNIILKIYKNTNQTLSAEYVGTVSYMSNQNELINSKWNYNSTNGFTYLVDTDDDLTTDPNNYVWYSGHLWQIFKKDSGNNLYLVTYTPVTSIAWGSGRNWNNSFVKRWLENVLYPAFQNKEYIDQNAVFDITPKDGQTITTTNKIGMLSLADYNSISNAIETANKSNNYLKLDGLYLLNDFNSSSLCQIVSSGLIQGIGKTGGIPIRAVIKLRSNIVYSKGKGTITDPYIIKSSDNSKNLSKKTVGEYVVFNNKIWRIQEQNSEGIRLIANFTNNTSSGNGNNRRFEAAENNFAIGTEGYMRDWINKTGNVISSSDYDKLANGTFYLGKYGSIGESQSDTYCNYETTTVTSGSNSHGLIQLKIGIPRVGELFATQDIRNLTTGKITLASYWTLTGSSSNSANAYFVSTSSGGRISTTGVAIGCDARPIITLESSTTISSGTGTFANPYILS